MSQRSIRRRYEYAFFVGSDAPAFAPGDVTGLLRWWKGDVGTFQTSGGAAAAADGDPVGEWQDQSANASHATQATASSKQTPFSRSA